MLLIKTNSKGAEYMIKAGTFAYVAYAVILAGATTGSILSKRVLVGGRRYRLYSVLRVPEYGPFTGPVRLLTGQRVKGSSVNLERRFNN